MQLKEKTERKDSDAGIFWLILQDIQVTFFKKKHLKTTASVLGKRYFTNKIVKSPLKKEHKIGNY